MKKIILYTIILLCLASKSFAAKSDIDELQNLRNRIAILEEKISKKENISKENAPINLQALSSLKLDGRIMIDGATVFKGKNNDTKNTIAVRRFWLGASGDIDKNWHYRGLVGFENNLTSALDVFISYSGFKDTNILIGNFFENNGIDVETPNLINSFMERSLAMTTFRELRRTGVSVNKGGENWGAHIGFFGSQPSNSGGNNKGYGPSLRFYIAPLHEKFHNLHLGYNTTYRTPDSNDNAIRFSSRGNTSNIINKTLIDTGLISNVNSYYQNALEFRYQQDSFTLTGEYIATNVNRSNSLPSLQFSGSYVSASYFLTGEKFGYNIKTGTPSAISVGKKPAIELAARYSQANLNDRDILGGKINSYDLGLNYYPHDNIRFMANYVYSRVDSAFTQQKNPQSLMFRAQVNF